MISPFACRGKAHCASPVTASGYKVPSSTVVASVIQIEISRFFFIIRSPLSQSDVRDNHVNQFDPDKRRDNSAQPVHQQVPPQQCLRAQRTVFHPAQSQRHQRNNNQRVENHRRKNRRVRILQSHHVQNLQLRESRCEHRRNNREIFRHIISHRKSRQRPARDQQLFTDFHHLNQFRRIRIQIHHVSGFLCRLRSRVHRQAHVAFPSPRPALVPAALLPPNFSF